MTKMRDEIDIQGKPYKSKKFLRAHFGVTDVALYRWAQRGLPPPAVKIGKCCYYDMAELERRLVEKS